MRRREFTGMVMAGAAGMVAPPVTASTRAPGTEASGEVLPAKGIAIEQCCGLVVDVQGGFYSQLDSARRFKVKANIQSFVGLLGYFNVPLVVTLERPVETKGALPEEIKAHIGDKATTFEKYFFDLTKERPIRQHLAQLAKKQMLVTGCETDVCVLQSCLGLLRLGYEVYVVEDLLFSLSPKVDAAIARMKAEGAIFLTYRSLYYEMMQAVVGGPYSEELLETFGPFPKDIPDSAF